MGLSVEPLSLSELEAAMALEASATPYCWSRGDWRSSLENDLCFKLQSDNRLLAVAAFSVVCDEVNLLNIAVAEDQKGKGYGKHLLQSCLDAFSAQSYKHCFLEVRRSNTPAIELYKKLGFAGIGERKNYYPVQGGREDALVLLCRFKQREQQHA